MRDLQKIRRKKAWNKKIPRSGDSDYLKSYTKFLRLIHTFYLIETSSIQALLGYKQKRTVQNFLHAMKNLGYINNIRIANLHYWFLTKKGADKLGVEINNDIHTINSTKQCLLVTRTLVGLTNRSEEARSGLITARTSDKLSIAEYVIGDNLYKICLVADTGRAINIQLEDSSVPIAFITNSDHKRAWEIVTDLADSGFTILATTAEAIDQYGPYAQIWASNLDLTTYISLSDLTPAGPVDDRPLVGTKDWQDMEG